ncbi:MAG: hypothetical protein HQL45_17380, partial [Alphaproteobacteria bacterium]|nr:hypothetical protein [Alphaproteobacteria bacterium]
MPFVSENMAGGNLPAQMPEEFAVPRPDFMRETLPAAFDLYNTVPAVVNVIPLPHIDQAKPDPAFDPFQSIQGYEEWAGSFVHADTPDEVARIKA